MAIKLNVADPQGLPLRTEQDAPLRLGVGEGAAYRSYDDLTDKPQINGVTLEGDKSSAELGVQGTDKLVQTVSASSASDEYPSARALWNQAAKYPKIKRFTGTSAPGSYFTFDTNSLADVYNAQTSGGQVVFIFDASQRITYRVNYCFIDRTDPAHERIVVYATADHVGTTQEPNFGISATYSDALYAKAAAGSQILYPLTTEYQEKLTFDDVPTLLSNNPVKSGGVYSALAGKISGGDVPVYEQDPTVPSWAKAATKPTYTPAEVGAQPAGDYAAAKAGDTTKTALATASIPFAQVSSTSTSTAFTATVPGITEYRDGVSFWLRNGVVTSAAGFTVNINGLGALKSFSNMAPTTQDTTLFNVNYTMLFVYCSWLDSGHGAFLMYRGYDANTNTIGYQVRTNSTHLPMTSTMYRYRLMFTSADGTHFVPANNSTSTNATAARTPCQDAIDPFGTIYYYSSTTAINQGAKPAVGSCWQQYTLTLGYSFNWTGAALTLTTDAPTYLVCNPQADGSAKIDSTAPIMQALPTTDDGKIYIFLGVAYSATQIELQINHPVYYYKNGAIRRWVGPV